MRAVQSILCFLTLAGIAALRAASLADPGEPSESPDPRSAPRVVVLESNSPLDRLDTSLSLRARPQAVPRGGVIALPDNPTDDQDSQQGDPTLPLAPPPFELPAFEPVRFTMVAQPTSDPALGFIQQRPEITPFEQPGSTSELLFRFDRNTNLSDGGLSDSSSLPNEDESFADTSAGERFNRYSMNIEWVPTGRQNQFQWLVVGGVQAIKADIGKLNSASLGLTQARGTVAIPTVGTGFRWSPDDWFSISTLARTQTLEGDASMTNLVVSADLMLTTNIGLSAGYEFFESDLTVENVNTQIDREGYFARLTIRF